MSTLRVLAVDVSAGTGGDESVIAYRENGIVEVLWKHRMADTMTLAGKTSQYARKYKVHRVIVDNTGIGAGVCDRLAEDAYVKPLLERFVAGGQPRNKNKELFDEEESFKYQYFNAKAEAYWEFRLKMEKGIVALPNDSVLVNQLQPMRYRLRSDRQIQIESKDELKRRGLKSPDVAEAVIMLFARGQKETSDINLYLV